MLLAKLLIVTLIGSVCAAPIKTFTQYGNQFANYALRAPEKKCYTSHSGLSWLHLIMGVGIGAGCTYGAMTYGVPGAQYLPSFASRTLTRRSLGTDLRDPSGPTSPNIEAKHTDNPSMALENDIAST